MEIIDRPLSEVIKEQKINQQLRRRGSKNGGEQSKEKAGGAPSVQLRNGRRKFRKQPQKRKGPASSISGRGGNRLRGRDSSRRTSAQSRRERRTYNDGGEQRNRGVKSSLSSRRSRVTGEERNERQRRRNRSSALEAARRSRR